MIVVVFTVTCRPERLEEARKAFTGVIAPSRATEGVLGFHIGQDLTDERSFIATEVFTDRAALDRQESLGEVGHVMGLFPEILAGDPSATIYEVSSAEPYGD